MNKFWDIVIKPLLEGLELKSIVEIGAQKGLNTVKLLNYCSEVKGQLYTIDPFPLFEYEKIKNEYESFTIYKELSLNALPKISNYDAVLIDGDHNWYTVYHELEMIEKNFKEKNRFPVVFLHDIGWPYGRRDLYYNPQNIPETFRQPYKKSGMVPNSSSLVENGLNNHLDNALHENNSRNGVLTAVEDFMSKSRNDYKLIQINGFFGLGILCLAELETSIRTILNKVNADSQLINSLEEDRIRNIIKLEDLNRTVKSNKFKLNEIKNDLNTAEDKVANLTEQLINSTEEKEELRDDNEMLIKEKESLTKEKDGLSKQIEELRMELLEKINSFTNHKEVMNLDLEQMKAQFEADIEKLKQDNKALKLKNMKLNKQVEKVKRQNKLAKASFRYQLGDIIASGAKPSINTLKLPFRIVKLIRKTLKRKLNDKQKKETQSNSVNNFTNEVLFKQQEFPTKIDIIIPVYNALEELKACIKSLREYTEFPHRVILINDKSPDPNVSIYLKEISGLDNIEVLENETNLGFIGTVNRGFDYATNDVVILNSDTRVTHEWLRSLVVCAYSDKKIGTVTPLSNAAGPFSVPHFNQNLDLQEGLTEHDYARIVAKYSDRNYPEVPTGNGFCMYIKKVALEHVGKFDTIFGKGYCEENDFCMRVSKAGMINVIDDSTFVFHQRTVSFASADKQKLIQNNRKLLDQKHPEYTSLVREFIHSNPLAALQEKMLSEFNAPQPSTKDNVLFVLHKGKGGTPLTNLDLLRNIKDKYTPYVLTSDRKELELSILDEYGALKPLTKISLVNEISVTEFYRYDYKHILENLLKKFDIKMVHIRHLLGHTFDLPKIAKELDIPIILSFHDFYFICPTIQLLDNKNVYCGGVCTKGDGECHFPKGWFPEMPHLKHNWVHEWREQVRGMFTSVDAFITTSKYTKERYTTIYPVLEEKAFHVIEHGRDFIDMKDVASPPTKNEKIKIVSFGGLNLQKGSKLLYDLMELDKKSGNRIELHLLGKIADRRLREVATCHGEYTRDNLEDFLGEIKPSLSAIFSIWPETYCHTLTESWALGVPPLVTNIGTLRERVLNTGAGWLVDVQNADEIYQSILEIIDNPSEYHRVKEKVDQLTFPTTLDMAKQYLEVYKQLNSHHQTIN